jgi:hypothetical protein
MFNEDIYFTLFLGYFLDTLESTKYLFVLDWILVFNAPLPEKKIERSLHPKNQKNKPEK